MVSTDELLCVVSPDEERREGSLREVHWTTSVKTSRPLLTCLIYFSQPRHPQKVKVEGLLDMGADVTIIASKDWSYSWPAQTTDIRVSGVGGSQYPVRSKE
ncbi:endogenous retrovirus group K member 8 Pro protein-like [Manacus candei]|uniref:endogenous retrovirus group K member 8 Pro protein-like n=1 Tax=Manacus candei TaxID=415023 RepID=UPI00222755B4|nr:endogenous retrovirus group K member 8 Pro protein-like [Manacus candei]XP_051630138.1 endogenous retrovirus group K member 8 Pro protein-like [Manacus candei]